MQHLTIDVDSVTSSGARVLAAADTASGLPATVITPVAADPISVGVAATLQASAEGHAAYSAAGAAITAARGRLLQSSASAYADQESANAALLSGGGDGGAGFVPPSPPVIALPMVPTAGPPVLGLPPGSGREISALVHAGPGPAGLLRAAQQLRIHAEQLTHSAGRINGAAGAVAADWNSESGLHAAHRLGELGTWLEQHATAAHELAATINRHAESFARAKSSIPTPQRFQDVENRLAAAAAANSNPANMGRYAPVVAALQAQLATMNADTQTAYSGVYRSDAASVTGARLRPPPQSAGSPTDGNRFVLPAGDEGAGTAPGAGPGIPPSIVGGRPRVERPKYIEDPNGAGTGPGWSGEAAPISMSQGAGAGPGAGPGVPPSIVGGGPAVERPIYPLDPSGAMPGPSVIPGEVAPVSASEGAGVVRATGFKTAMGDGWDDETEEELEVPFGWVQDWTGKWSPPVAVPGGAMGHGSGRAPI